MDKTANPILVGIVAGLIAAILVAGSVYVPLLLQILAITVLFIAGLGYGRVAGIVAVATTAIALGVVTGSAPGALMLGLMLLPAAVMSYLAGLARPAQEIGGPETSMAWYPLADILFAGAVLTALATIALLMIQPMDQVYAVIVDEAARMVTEASPSSVFTPESKAEMVQLLKKLGPMSQGVGNMMMLFAGFYFAMRILSALKRNVRPREDIRSSLRMNRVSVAVFAGAVLLALAGEPLSIIGASFAGAMAGGFLLSGYAIIHEAVRLKSWALPALIIVYLVTFIFPPLMLIIAIAGGLANPRRAVALTPVNSASNNNTKPQD